MCYCHLCVSCLCLSPVFFACIHWKWLNKVSFLSCSHHPHCKSQLCSCECVYVCASFGTWLCTGVTLLVCKTPSVVILSVSDTINFCHPWGVCLLWHLDLISNSLLCVRVCVCLVKWKMTHSCFEHATNYKSLPMFSIAWPCSKHEWPAALTHALVLTNLL